MREHHYRNRDYDDPETGEDGTLHIASLLVHVRPVHIPAVSAWVETCPELEIHLGNDEGKLVMVLETADHHFINTMIETIKDQQGVLNVAMVYHEELKLSEVDHVLEEQAAAADSAQPVKIVGEL
ncbi:chaperone NapD [Microbulbifer mangrovi]|uniref:chaperone NapD n=1 Tax=Microbulbifer mangrovi TaxID=927787 RepID=UPI0009905D87|nr:chaperone NapD [Microbulbifer mangrovi]